jgi:hypothetical protein
MKNNKDNPTTHEIYELAHLRTHVQNYVRLSSFQLFAFSPNAAGAWIALKLTDRNLHFFEFDSVDLPKLKEAMYRHSECKGVSDAFEYLKRRTNNYIDEIATNNSWANWTGVFNQTQIDYFNTIAASVTPIQDEFNLHTKHVYDEVASFIDNGWTV